MWAWMKTPPGRASYGRRFSGAVRTFHGWAWHSSRCPDTRGIRPRSTRGRAVRMRPSLCPPGTTLLYHAGITRISSSVFGSQYPDKAENWRFWIRSATLKPLAVPTEPGVCRESPTNLSWRNRKGCTAATSRLRAERNEPLGGLQKSSEPPCTLQ
jgi:hypothetical protein